MGRGLVSLRDSGTYKLRNAARRMPGAALLRRSIASQLVVLLLGATLLTSLVVTWVSTKSIEGFLRREVDQEFPAILSATSERLDLWYSQRKLDVETYARSATITRGAEGLSREPGPDAAREVHDYLVYVLDRFPQYVAIVLLDPAGRELSRVGEQRALDRALSSRLAGVSTSRVGAITMLGGRRVQIMSSVVIGTDDRKLGSLHALMPASQLDALLTSDRLGHSGQIFVVGDDSRYLTPARGRAPGQRFDLELPKSGAATPVLEYRNAADERVFGSRVRLRRFGWTLVVEESASEVFQPALLAVGAILGVNLIAVVLFGGAAFLVARSIVRPIDALSRAARRIADGEADEAIEPPATDSEIGVLVGAFNRMTGRLRRQRVELRESQDKVAEANTLLRGQNEELQRVNEVLEQLSITDGLTRLHNHRFFQEQLAREIKRIERAGGSLFLVLIDIDDFKQLNDQYGHASGDAVLCDVARVMARIVRESDVLARYGGEEFALIPGQTDLEGAVGLAEKIRVAVAGSVVVLEGQERATEASVTVSIGVAQYCGDPRALFNDADRALYRAKGSGKDCVVVEPAD